MRWPEPHERSYRCTFNEGFRMPFCGRPASVIYVRRDYSTGRFLQRCGEHADAFEASEQQVWTGTGASTRLAPWDEIYLRLAPHEMGEWEKSAAVHRALEQRAGPEAVGAVARRLLLMPKAGK
jgi:hypothetical protein